MDFFFVLIISAIFRISFPPFDDLLLSIKILPETLQTIFKFNPLYVYINSIREIVLFGNAPTITYLLVGLLVGFVTMLVGMLVFRKKQDKFVYYI